jgi:hypothetical protein
MDNADNAELMNYYRDRQAWLIEPDSLPAIVTPYPGIQTSAAGQH